MSLSEADAVRAYARMLNKLDASEFLALLTEDFVYTSFWVFKDITSAAEFAAYIGPKFEAVRAANATIFAELGRVHDPFRGEVRPCVILTQDDRDSLKGLAFADITGERVSRISLQGIPSVQSAQRLGEYPE